MSIDFTVHVGTVRSMRQLIYQNPKDAKIISNLLLTPGQRKSLKWSEKKGPITARDCAAKEDISINCASTKLRYLHLRGWLTRVRQMDPSGGPIYEYKLVEFGL